ncbi:signal peptidase I [Parachitinimonas caeni]|uniref:Signal peptidase I n=1 Tax=Parachitinimonas caeni TaxID=3031301 RepID=A0ABT7DVZ7_9NEIS|nr:signal peptidase I [Parachitinimonas caeni]MDK2124235.1 signal peptidase I [Parachitinimonas caeni]
MNWIYIFIGAIFIGAVLAIQGQKSERKGNEPPPLVQSGYLAIVIGIFGLLAQVLTLSAVLLIFVVASGIIAAIEKFMLAPKRAASSPQPDWVEYGSGLFPILLVVFLLRSFLIEPFQIPSSSMRPGLVVGDFILVNKFTYGIRVPVLNNILISVNKPAHGDVMVFINPKNTSQNYIKRVIGLPGDKVEYKNKQLSINGKPVPREEGPAYSYMEQDRGLQALTTHSFYENFEGKHYATLIRPDAPTYDLGQVQSFSNRDNCQYNDDGFSCVVPSNHYFMMGDNRDGSLDSRYWGFVPDDHIVGKAFFIWLSLADFGRIGTVIR